MSTIECLGEQIEVTNEGYLANPGVWNEDVARSLAQNLGVDELSGDLMEIIIFMREYFHKYDAFPMLTAVCRNLNEPKSCFKEQIDPVTAWKIAGLPEPPEEVVSYLRPEL